MADDLDIGMFIDEIKKYPEIWNAASEDYHVRAKKKIAWMNISRIMCENFEEKDDRDKNVICK